jgi:Phosphomannomutase
MKINPNGFREYDARWLFEKDIDIDGIKDLGKGLGTQIISHTKKTNPRVIVGHDYRSYSEEIKKSLVEGLISTGCNIEDIGLSLTPMVYFAQFNLNSDAIAMVTASHNENGWTGVKMGIKKGLTHGPEEMSELKKITLNKEFINGKGATKNIYNFKENYINDLIKKKFNKKIKAVVSCGNGTAGIFARKYFKKIRLRGYRIRLQVRLVISKI